MTIQRVPAMPFAQIANDALRDSRLSFKARGLLAMVLSHAGEWNATARWLESQSERDGREAIQSALNELTTLGYRDVTHERMENGEIRTVVVWRQVPEVRDSRPTGNPANGETDQRETRGTSEHHSSEHHSPEHHESVPVAPPQGETLNSRIQRLTKVYTDLVPLSRFPAIMGIVGKAVRTGRYTDDDITGALQRLAGEGRPVTVDVLRIELEGLPASRQRSKADQRLENFAHFAGQGAISGQA